MSVDDDLNHIRNTDGTSSWGTSRLDPNHLGQRMLCVYFCTHTNELNCGADGQPPTNHWSLSSTLPTERSTRIDVVPSKPGRPGMVTIEGDHGSPVSST
ncbi:hypothetical protein BS47DRAFT_1388203 [Hydnum rufescens UP504]|uniref:Uncharacterized protein n=1 Tax=Hydnum rufescens UP504 TaxID=1448309 RepID=A0A9P6B8H9_9AGAM|nr:hypothetical protein BS47DRAFT_1388203 [Hydnum rufescens UP504]